MKLIEFKSKTEHYFRDEQGQFQGQYKDWYENGQQWEISNWKDNELHGEFKYWYSNGCQETHCHYHDGDLHGEFKSWSESGELDHHTFDINDEEIINFLENPELYPTTPEERTMFVLKYGSAPFIGEAE